MSPISPTHPIAPLRSLEPVTVVEARRPVVLSRSQWFMARLSASLPILIMAALALGSFWLLRMSPKPGTPDSAKPVTHDPDYVIKNFNIKSYANGAFKTQLLGVKGQHYPDTDTIEVTDPQLLSLGQGAQAGQVSTAKALRSLNNADASQVQLYDKAVVVREAFKSPDGKVTPRLEIRSDFLDIFSPTERVKTHLPVEIFRDADRYTADSADFDNIARVLHLQGRVNVLMTSKSTASAAAPVVATLPPSPAPEK